MDRNLHKKYIPNCPKNIALVDQYMWNTKDTSSYGCQSGLSHTIYNCNGDISYSLPLFMYPPVNKIHPQIKLQQQENYDNLDSLTSKFKKQNPPYYANDFRESNILYDISRFGYDKPYDFSVPNRYKC